MKRFAAILKTERNDYESHKINARRCELKQITIRDDGLSNSLTTVMKDNLVLVDTRKGDWKYKELSKSDFGWFLYLQGEIESLQGCLSYHSFWEIWIKGSSGLWVKINTYG